MNTIVNPSLLLTMDAMYPAASRSHCHVYPTMLNWTLELGSKNKSFLPSVLSHGIIHSNKKSN